MPLAKRNDPFRTSRYIVEIDGITQAGFSKATVSTSTVTPIEYREGNEPNTVRKIPGLETYSNVILEYGITDSMELYNWHKDILDGKIKNSRKTVHILFLDEEGNEATRWTFDNAWITVYTAPPGDAKANEIGIEKLELAVEGSRRVK
jgi:phage tail-like protein